MKEQQYRSGATGALMDEYEKAVRELKECIAGLQDKELTAIVDADTADPNCHSIQTVLSHVVHSGYGYAMYVQWLKGIVVERPDKVFHHTVAPYLEDLDRVIAYTDAVFQSLSDTELEVFDEAGKIMTGWGQVYDIEQMAEHAIVHILRHRRQIERFKILLRAGDPA